MLGIPTELVKLIFANLSFKDVCPPIPFLFPNLITPNGTRNELDPRCLMVGTCLMIGYRLMSDYEVTLVNDNSKDYMASWITCSNANRTLVYVPKPCGKVPGTILTQFSDIAGKNSMCASRVPKRVCPGSSLIGITSY